jgi:hypothetical protein
MRCEKCGRDMNNAELWQLATDPKAPTSWSMQQLCWDCRQHPERATQQETGDMVRQTEADETVTLESLADETVTLESLPLEQPDLQRHDTSLYN